jgi:hypothetical protein
MALENWKKKKSKKSYSIRLFGPVSPTTGSPPSIRPPFSHAWAVPFLPPRAARFSSFPASLLWPSPASGLAHARAPAFHAHRSHLKPSPASLSFFADAKSSAQSSPFLTRSAFGLYKQGCRTSPHPSRPLEAAVVLERLVTACGSPSRRLSEPHAFLGSSSALISPLVSSH